MSRHPKRMNTDVGAILLILLGLELIVIALIIATQPLV